jgi:transposase InsO family protein
MPSTRPHSSSPQTRAFHVCHPACENYTPDVSVYGLQRPWRPWRRSSGPVPIRCVSSSPEPRTGRSLGRPWLTLLVDAFSRRTLATCLTLDAPTYRSCMLVLKRHGRLPQTLVLDGGREFESTYFETLLARYECTKKTRPPAKARFGSVCERLFGTSVVDNRNPVDRHRGGGHPPTPATPPCVRVRTRRFDRLR